MNVKTKTNWSFAVKVTEEATIHFYCLLDESRFSDICTIIELKELNWLCKHKKATNFVFQWIFSVKSRFFHVSIVNQVLPAKGVNIILNSVIYIQTPSMISPISSLCSLKPSGFYKRTTRAFNGLMPKQFSALYPGQG